MSDRPARPEPLDGEELRRLHAYWRAANYLSVGQIYLLDNPLLREPLRVEHVKPRLLGHWGTTPGLNFVYAHMNRAIRARDLNAIYLAGPGHGGPGWWRTPTSRAPTARSIPRSAATRKASGASFASSPSRAGSRATSRPRRLGRSTRAASWATRWSHAYGAVLDNPELLACCVVGRRRGRDRPAGRELAGEQVRRTPPATARCCRSCTSTATRSPTRRCSRASRTRSCARCSRATATSRCSSRATSRRRCTS